ncbi:MAG TPA: (d)CMP kinase [Vicinamibacteria bacterium]|nr:(d)CMP kinase [Vicinamibacteria bacterium]
MKPRGLVIAIDGPSGAGKSTAGRALAARLSYTFIDTGAMYRALALKAARSGADPDDAEALAALLHAARIELSEGGRRVLLDGEDVTEAIRTREASVLASRVSVHPAVRREMVARQRALGAGGGVVLDGRDIGSAVFPDADLKFYVDADPRERAERRRAELLASGSAAEIGAIEREIRDRDQADMTRADSPLVRTADAVLVDTTTLTPEQVLERMLAAVRAT